MTPRLSLSDLPLEPWTQGSAFGSADSSFAKRLGLRLIGASYNEVPPGKSGCPFHNHRGEDELYVILEGSGLYRFGEERIAVSAGDVLGAPAGGPDTAHQLINTGERVLRYLVVSNQAPVDIVEYPDSGKVLGTVEDAPADDGFRHMTRRRESVDYWEDEPGAL
jgi:uncharacterized cupin superfamily protein